MSVLELHPFLMCIDLRDISCPYKDRLRLRTSARPLNQPHPLLSWLVFAAYCCLLTTLGTPTQVSERKAVKNASTPKNKNKLGCTSTACNIWMHLALESYVPGYGAIPAGTQMRVFFGPTGLAKLGYVTSQSVPQLLTLNLAFSREMSSNVSFSTNYGASAKIET